MKRLSADVSHLNQKVAQMQLSLEAGQALFFFFFFLQI